MLEPGDRLDYPVLTGIDRKFLSRTAGAKRERPWPRRWGSSRQSPAAASFSLSEVSELHYDPIEGYVLITLAGGVPIRLGFGSFADKLDRLERIYPELKLRLATLKYIDLNVADRVIVRIDRQLAQGNS